MLPTAPYFILWCYIVHNSSLIYQKFVGRLSYKCQWYKILKNIFILAVWQFSFNELKYYWYINLKLLIKQQIQLFITVYKDLCLIKDNGDITRPKKKKTFKNIQTTRFHASEVPVKCENSMKWLPIFIHLEPVYSSFMPNHTLLITINNNEK